MRCAPSRTKRKKATSFCGNFSAPTGTSRTLELPPPRVIAVDVDGTLHIGGEANTKAIAWLHKRKAQGFTLMLWSMRGERHARLIAEQMQCLDLFDAIVSKPGFILDDEGWAWIKRTKVVRVTE